MSDGPSMSVAMRMTFIGPVYQPFVPCGPEMEAAVIGASLSIFGAVERPWAPAWMSTFRTPRGRSSFLTTCTLRMPPCPATVGGSRFEVRKSLMLPARHVPPYRHKLFELQEKCARGVL